MQLDDIWRNAHAPLRKRVARVSPGVMHAFD